ncbi:phenylacetate--CoA ligase family protein [Candidatus Stoquefichus massiliensis]|uniref:phenylacetate--CoA ligase family protein n=1 Tax=Candidatus Stoquefichus massiliensis TaxID=1470350 RepID=UPI000480784F|nr:phenylacetate--CoA ligase family protein [Candidatus Stoquefichus massiliensis]
MFNKLRREVFFLLDKLKGSIITNNLMILNKYDKLSYNDEWLLNDRKKNIERLIETATNKTEFYSINKGMDFMDFPLINKNIIKDNQEKIMNSDYKHEQLFQMATSGSTGTPFICYQNAYKKKKVSSEIIFYSQKVGYKIGNNLIYLRSLSNRSKKPYYKQLMQNQFTLDCNNLSNDKLKFLLNKIIKYSQNGKAMLLGYGSTYKVLSEYIKNNHNLPNIKLSGVVSGSDMLFDDVRKNIEETFQCRCYSRYSNEENGVIGQDELENNVFYLNEANYYVEIFKLNEDKPADEGEIGRIVVTDLYNYAMPMIRYDTGDIGRISYRKDHNGIAKRVIDQFGGRKIDIIYKTTGEVISPHSITNMMWDYPNIRQFQFIQSDEKEYKLILNISNNIDVALIESELKEIVGQDAIIAVEFVDEIPVLSSGKRRYISNEWRK